jgi:hypothetical protein
MKRIILVCFLVFLPFLVFSLSLDFQYYGELAFNTQGSFLIDMNYILQINKFRIGLQHNYGTTLFFTAYTTHEPVKVFGVHSSIDTFDIGLRLGYAPLPSLILDCGFLLGFPVVYPEDALGYFKPRDHSDLGQFLNFFQEKLLKGTAFTFTPSIEFRCLRFSGEDSGSKRNKENGFVIVSLGCIAKIGFTKYDLSSSLQSFNHESISSFTTFDVQICPRILFESSNGVKVALGLDIPTVNSDLYSGNASPGSDIFKKMSFVIRYGGHHKFL